MGVLIDGVSPEAPVAFGRRMAFRRPTVSGFGMLIEHLLMAAQARCRLAHVSHVIISSAA